MLAGMSFWPPAGNHMRHDWILDVLADLRNYARKNGMRDLADQVERTLAVARAEIAAAETSEDTGDNGGSGGPPPGGRPN
jgi:hypothetical protein